MKLLSTLLNLLLDTLPDINMDSLESLKTLWKYKNSKFLKKQPSVNPVKPVNPADKRSPSPDCIIIDDDEPAQPNVPTPKKQSKDTTKRYLILI